MGRFSELNKNINYVTELLLTNQNLLKLIKYNDTNPLSHSDISDPYELLFKNINPQPKSVRAVEEKTTYLNYVFSNLKLNDKNFKFKDSKVFFYIISHNDIWAINGGIRPNQIVEEIDNTLNERRGTSLSIGKVIFGDCIYREFSDNFSGYVLTYDLCDFN